MAHFNHPPRFFIGIDPAAESFTASLLTRPDAASTTDTFSNDLSGFDAFVGWLAEQEVVQGDCLVCLEATGVYAEQLCYFLFERGIPVAVEAPLKVQRAFKTSANKNDPTDSRQIAECLEAVQVFGSMRLSMSRTMASCTIASLFSGQRS